MAELHDYQRRAVEHLHGTGEPGAGLFLDMGLGKTATVLTALTPVHLPALVLAPKRVAEEVWDQETEKWRPDLSTKVLVNLGPTKAYPREADRRRHLLLKPTTDIAVITRDQIGCLAGHKHPYRTVVLDELSGYKNGGRQGTARWKETRKVTDQADHVWGLTGTPAPNGYHDLWAQIFLLDKGKRLGTTLTAYRDRYFTPGHRMPVTNIVTEWLIKPGAEDAINRLLEDLCLSMKAEDYLELPEVTFNEVKITLPPVAKKAYADMDDTLVADLTLLGGAVHTAPTAAALTNKMRQITAGFIYHDQDTTQNTRLHDEKTRALQEIIDGTGSPVLVFYQFNEEKRNILDKIEGAVLIDAPNAVADWNAGKIHVLVAHPASAGHGLNLQHGGHVMVWTSLPWSLEEWQQSIGRLARQGQQYPVIIHTLIAPGTLDRYVLTALKNKQSVQDALLNYLRERHLFL